MADHRDREVKRPLRGSLCCSVILAVFLEKPGDSWTNKVKSILKCSLTIPIHSSVSP
jgi:hypothetical protein